jgi:hypothetical protein
MSSIQTHQVSRKALLDYLRTGTYPDAAAHARKYNHNHDPYNGQFTSGPGGGSATNSGTTTPHPALPPRLAQATSLQPIPPKPTLAQQQRGPFSMHAEAHNVGGDVARGLNEIATTPSSVTKIPFGGTILTVTRDAGDRVTLQTPLPAIVGKEYSLHATGRITRTTGKQEIIFSDLQTRIDKPNSEIISAPSKITVSARSNGDMVYSIDKDIYLSVIVRMGIRKSVVRKAGTFYVYKKPRV